MDVSPTLCSHPPCPPCPKPFLINPQTIPHLLSMTNWPLISWFPTNQNGQTKLWPVFQWLASKQCQIWAVFRQIGFENSQDFQRTELQPDPLLYDRCRRRGGPLLYEKVWWVSDTKCQKMQFANLLQSLTKSKVQSSGCGQQLDLHVLSKNVFATKMHPVIDSWTESI